MDRGRLSRNLDDGSSGVFEKKHEKTLSQGVFAGQADVEEGGMIIY